MSLGAEVGLPTGEAGTFYNIAPGASLKLEVPVSASMVNVTGSVGFSSFIPKGIYRDYGFSAATYVPVEAGVKVYVIPAFYINADAGASINVNRNYSATRTAFIYAPGLGVSIPAGGLNAADIGLRYEGRAESGATVSQVALRIAYKFGL